MSTADVEAAIPFKLATVRRTSDALAAALVLGDGMVDVVAAARALERPLATTLAERSVTHGAQALLDDWPRSFEAVRELAELVRARGVEDPAWSLGSFETGDTRVRPPLPAPPKMLWAASNYAAHVRDFDGDQRRAELRDVTGIDRTTTQPYLFPKLPQAVSGPYDRIVRPQVTRNLDFEVELAAVLGRGGKRITADRAAPHIAGYLLANDLTCRDLQVRDDWAFFRTDWFAGKCFDGAAPLGPFFVPAEFVADYRALRLRLSVNGEGRQDAYASDMVFSIEEQIAFASSTMELVPGDVFGSGTPAGVGSSTGRFLEVGDVVEASIDGLGSQRNEIVAEELPDDDRFRLVPPDAHLAQDGGTRA